jgi:fibronectin-binding autotransporter adhesin
MNSTNPVCTHNLNAVSGRAFLKQLWVVAAIASMASFASSAKAANTVSTWAGAGTSGGTSATDWTSITNYSGGSFSATNDLDFSTITTSTSVSPITLAATGASTINVGNLIFGTSLTEATPMFVNINGDGTAGDVTINLNGYIASPTATSTNSTTNGNVTFGSDLTINLVGTVSHSITYKSGTSDNGTNAPSAVVINSLVTGGASGSQFGTNGVASTVYLVLTNNNNSYVGTIQAASGSTSFTSITSASGTNSALGSTSDAIAFGNSGGLIYIGSGDETSTRTLTFSSTNIFGNYASTPSNLTYSGTFQNQSTLASNGALRLGVGSGNTITMASAIGNGTITGTGIGTGGIESVAKYSGISYFNSAGAYVAGGGTGTLVLSGANTYAGSTQIQAGQLIINSIANGGQVTTLASGFSSGATTITVTNGSNLSTGEVVSGLGIMNGTTITNISGSVVTLSTATGAASLTGSSVYFGTANSLGISTSAATNLEILGGSTLQYVGAAASTDRLIQFAAGGSTSIIDASGSGAIVFTNTGTSTFNTGGGIVGLILTGTNTGLNTFDEDYTNNGVANYANTITKSGVGTWVLGGASSYSGTTTVSGGTLDITSLANAGVTSLTATTTLGSNTITVSGTTGLAVGMTVVEANIPTGTTIYSISGTTVTLSGTATGSASGSNAQFGILNALGFSANTGTNLDINGGILAYTGTTSASTDRLFEIGATTTGGTGEVDASGVGSATLAFTNTGSIVYGTNNQTRTLVLGGSNTGANTLAALIKDNGTGAVSLNKTGLGAWTLTGTNTYTGGTTISSGTLVVSNIGTGSATGTGALSLSSGATLMGAGRINSTSNTINGNVIVGNGTDTTSFLTMTATGTTTITNATLAFNLDSTSTNSNKLAVGASNAVVFGTGDTLSLNITGTSVVANATQYELFNSTVTGSGVGGSIYSGLTLSGSNVISGLTLNIASSQAAGYYSGSYLMLVADGSGYDIDLEVQSVPEPSTYAMLLGGLALLIVFQRARRQKNG